MGQCLQLPCWLQAMLAPARFPAIAAPFNDSARNGLQNLFACCYVWALGGTLDAAGREAFDRFAREAFQGVANFPPGAGLVHDFYCDPDRCAALWPVSLQERGTCIQCICTAGQLLGGPAAQRCLSRLMKRCQ